MRAQAAKTVVLAAIVASGSPMAAFADKASPPDHGQPVRGHGAKRHPQRPRVDVHSRSSVANAFARAYLRFIDGTGKASSLPACTRAVKVAAVRGGRIPPKNRHPRVALVALKPEKSAPASLVITAHVGRRHGEPRRLFAQETLTRRGGRWVVTKLMTPDYVQVFTHSVVSGPTAPRGSGPPEAAAKRFLAAYMPWRYGHGPVSAITDSTPRLLERLAASPPRIPPTMLSLPGRVRAIVMRRDGVRWKASVNVRDRVLTYGVTLTLLRSKGQKWLVTNVTTVL